MAEQFYGISLGYMVHVIGWPQSVKMGGSWHSGNIFLTSRKKIAVIQTVLSKFELLLIWLVAMFHITDCNMACTENVYIFNIVILHDWYSVSKPKRGEKNGVSTFFRHIFYQDCFACWDIFIFSFCWFQRSSITHSRYDRSITCRDVKLLDNILKLVYMNNLNLT